MAVFSASGFAMLVMTGFLGLAAVVQTNDPDPLRWMAAYGLPSVITLWACVTDSRSWMWSVSCIIVLAGVSLLAVSVVYPVASGGSIDSILSSEEGRESAGLLIVILWLLLLLLFQRRYLLDCGLLAFAVVPPSLWLAYKFYVQQTLTLPEHCEGLI